MLTRLLICLSILLPALADAQVSDFVVVKKKNNRTVKTIFPGSPVAFHATGGRYIEGYVEAVRDDSVFVRQYDIQAVPTQFGVSRIDTLGVYIVGVNYKEIGIVTVKSRQSFGFIRSGTLFIIAGLGYAALNLINGGVLNQPSGDNENIKKLGVAVGVAGVGFLMRYLNHRSQTNEKKYKVQYIHMSIPKAKGV